MQLIKTLSVLAIATGVAVAAPGKRQGNGWWGNGNRWWNPPSDGASVTVDGFSPEATGWGGDDSAPAASPTAAATTTTTTSVVQVTAAPSQPANNFHGGNFSPNGNSSPQAAPSSSGGWGGQAPAAPTSAPSTGGSGGQSDYMSVVSQFRALGGLPALTQDSTLEGNAAKTCADSGGQLNHELNPGTFAQVLAPGSASEFYSCYLGGWLCEIPSLPGLGNLCQAASQGWNHGGETGHADILTSTKYTKIGCSNGSGIWACDLA